MQFYFSYKFLLVTHYYLVVNKKFRKFSLFFSTLGLIWVKQAKNATKFGELKKN